MLTLFNRRSFGKPSSLASIIPAVGANHSVQDPT